MVETYAQSENQNVVTWGSYASQLVTTYVPQDLTNAIQVAVGMYESLALRSDGTIVSWSNFTQSEPIKTYPEITNAVAVSAANYYLIVLLSDGTVAPVGDGYSPSNLGITNLISISAGRENLGLQVNGKVLSWSSYGVLNTNVPVNLSNVIAISAGYWQNLALKSDGTVVAWGATNTVATGLTNIIAIAAGNNHSLALRSNGRIISWGDNTYGQRNGLAPLTNVVGISAGHLHSIALLSNGVMVIKGLTILTNIPDGLPFVTSLGSRLSTNMCGVIVDTGRATTPPVVLSIQPPAQTQSIGSTAYLAVYAVGVNLHYKWYHETNLLAGETNSWITLSDLHLAQSGQYWVTVSNEAGTVSSQSASVSVVLTAGIFLTPTVVLGGEVGAQVRIDYINSIGPTNAWFLLATIQMTNNPQFFFDTSGVGQPVRYYRTVQLP